MNRNPQRLRHLVGGAMLAMLLAGCGGGEPEAANSGHAHVLAVAPTMIAPLFDDAGHVMPASDSAAPDDAGAHTRNGRYATADQASLLEAALGPLVIAVSVQPGAEGGAALDQAVQQVAGHRAAHGLAVDAPVLVRSADLRLGAAAVHHLEAQGYERVFLVTR